MFLSIAGGSSSQNGIFIDYLDTGDLKIGGSGFGPDGIVGIETNGDLTLNLANAANFILDTSGDGGGTFLIDVTGDFTLNNALTIDNADRNGDDYIFDVSGHLDLSVAEVVGGNMVISNATELSIKDIGTGDISITSIDNSVTTFNVEMVATDNGFIDLRSTDTSTVIDLDSASGFW